MAKLIVAFVIMLGPSANAGVFDSCRKMLARFQEMRATRLFPQLDPDSTSLLNYLWEQPERFAKIQMTSVLPAALIVLEQKRLIWSHSTALEREAGHYRIGLTNKGKKLAFTLFTKL